MSLSEGQHKEMIAGMYREGKASTEIEDFHPIREIDRLASLRAGDSISILTTSHLHITGRLTNAVIWTSEGKIHHVSFRVDTIMDITADLVAMKPSTNLAGQRLLGKEITIPGASIVGFVWS